MLDKPITFTILNLISYILLLGIFGFSASFYLSIIISLFIIFYNFKFVGFSGSLVLSIIYLLCFDSPLFYFTEANIRVWYIYLIILYGYLIIKIVNGEEGSFKFHRDNLIQYFGAIILIILSIFYLLTDDFISVIYNIKYWVFYVGLFLIINNFFKKHIDKFDQISDFFISLTIFICVFGLFQFGTNLLLIPNFQLDYFNIRPSGFFSETTWYSEFIFFGLIFIFLKIIRNKKDFNFIYFIPLFLLGITISLTRNTFVSLFIYFSLTIFFTIFVEKHFFTRIFSSWFVKLLSICMIGLLFILLPKLGDTMDFIALKFSGNDGSAQGRIEAYNLSWDMITKKPILGNGFYWDVSQTTYTGSSLGAKSFNLFLMIMHIFGFFGFTIFFVFIIGGFLYKIMRDYLNKKSIYIRYSLIVFLCFLQMAMFAPIHQYPFGMLIISLSSLLYLKGARFNKKIIYES